MMSDMERDILDAINPKPDKMIDKAHLSISQVHIDDYWTKYFESCEMCDPETGLEMPYEEDFTYSYHPNADEYNRSYGW